MGRTSTIGTGNPQHALSAKVATGPARKLMVTCLSISMNSGSGKFGVCFQITKTFPPQLCSWRI